MANDLTIGSGSSGAIDNAPVTTNLPGGTISFQTGRASDIIDSRFPNETTRGGVNNGEGYRTDANGNTEEFGAITKHQVTGPAITGNPVDSALTQWGTSPREITPDCSMHFPGWGRVQVASAVRDGWLRKVGGDYVATGKDATDLAELQGAK
jgi:hypothetical protein